MKVKKIDENTTLTPELISTLKKLAYNHKNRVLFDRYGNTILHHLLQVKGNYPSKIVYKILKSAPEEVRHKLLNHENKNKKTIFDLALEANLHELLDKLLVYNILDMERELEEREKEAAEIYLNVSPYGCSIHIYNQEEHKNKLFFPSKAEAVKVIRNTYPSTDLRNLEEVKGVNCIYYK